MPGGFDSAYSDSGWPDGSDHTTEPETEELSDGSPELSELLAREAATRELDRLGVADVPAGDRDPNSPSCEHARLNAGIELVPGYRLVGRIGEGGSGEVWKAVGPGGLSVAMKFVRVAEEFGSSPASQQRLRANLRALELMREVRHANLLPLFGAWHRDGLLIFGMELADRTLLDRYNEAVREGESGIPFPELVEFMRQAASGIDYLNAPRHALVGRQGVGVLHRDVKPQNLLLVGGCVKVGDFGQAKLMEDTARNTGSLTAYYAPPELFDGMMSRRSDQYSLAVTYCQLRCGRLPYTGSPLEIMMGHFRGVPELGRLRRHERSIVERALAKRPHERWPDCRSFVEAIAESGGLHKRRRAAHATAPERRTFRERRSGRLGRLASLASSTAAFLAVAASLAGGRAQAPKPHPFSIVKPPPSREVADEHPPGAVPDAVVSSEEVAGADLEFGASDSPVGPEVEDSPPVVELAALPLDVWAPAARAEPPRKHAEPRFEPALKVVPRPVPEAVDRRPKTATIDIFMPTANAELVVRGAVGRGNPDEWYGPRRVVHTPPLSEGADYLIGGYFLGADGRPTTRTRSIHIEPGGRYEIDLRPEHPTSREISDSKPPEPYLPRSAL